MRRKDEAERSRPSIRSPPRITNPQEGGGFRNCLTELLLQLSAGGRRIVGDGERWSLLPPEFVAAVGGQAIRTLLLRGQTCDDELLLWGSA